LNLWWNLELADIPIACKQHWPKNICFTVKVIDIIVYFCCKVFSYYVFCY
jgi:hypothetical protein